MGLKPVAIKFFDAIFSLFLIILGTAITMPVFTWLLPGSVIIGGLIGLVVGLFYGLGMALVYLGYRYKRN